MGIAISTAGFYRTDDGGKSWRARNIRGAGRVPPRQAPRVRPVRAQGDAPSRAPGAALPAEPLGLYRSDDWGDSWQDIANGVPSDFGFPIQSHPHEPDTVYAIPLQSDEFRVVPEAKLRVYRTRDAGASWAPLTDGLPQSRAFESVLRDGLAVDSHEPAGVYFGTRSGKLYASSTDGEQWKAIAESLPSICCVKTAVVGRPDARERSRGHLRRSATRARCPTRAAWAPLQIDAPCPTVRDALAATAARWPAVIDRVLTEQGALRRHVNVFVGDESIAFLDGLDTRVDEGATITIVPAVSGG
jgi:molybdopterin converting factor small subunit